ncbi:MAG: hypothetical protein JWQ81_6936 [Amycolatopsis sp.]|uniref:hypothetical protein n=1 Tax=Amycolatopsis sp. TaxID=37632 RepID=UPI002601A463|nr:hypothetical protein [Amycolatopsis sp.]MCU1686197.1 hypothetical protein [Amycolatopsis sp.]
MNESRLGVDFGKVINAGRSAPGKGDTVFLSGGYDQAMATPASAGCFDALARLTAQFEGRVWVVSKCGERIQQRTEQWLDHHDFWARTGIDSDQLRFCRRRPDKAVHCAELGITHFVDDRADVLGHLRDLVPHLYLFGHQGTPPPPWVRHTLDWADVEREIGLDTPALSSREGRTNA